MATFDGPLGPTLRDFLINSNGEMNVIPVNMKKNQVTCECDDIQSACAQCYDLVIEK